MAANMITLHFITEGRESDFDDIIKITHVPDHDDLYEATYTYASSRRTKRARFPKQRVIDWVGNILRLTIADCEPADQLQFTAPMMPVTLFNVGELMDNYTVLSEALRFSIDNWPEEDMVADDASTLTYTTEAEAETEEEAEDEVPEEEHYPTPPRGSEPMMEEDSYRPEADPLRSVSLGADGRIQVQTHGRHHLFFSSDSEATVG
jgi:hypothetical protein